MRTYPTKAWQWALAAAISVLGTALIHAQTAQPDLTRILGTAKVEVDLFSPAQRIRVTGLPKGTDFVSALFVSQDELLGGQPWVMRHSNNLDEELEGGGYDEDWDGVTPGHLYDISVEYDVMNPDGTETHFRTESVRVLHLEWER